MRRVDVILMAIGLLAALTWVVFTGKDGYKSSNATIVARSLSISATIDGQVDNHPPVVGTRVDSNDLLVRVHNNRIDKSRLVEYDTEIAFLKNEIKNIEQQQEEMSELLQTFQLKADAHAAWMLKDAKLRKKEAETQLQIARMNEQLKSDDVARAEKLYKLQHTSSALLKNAQAEADIAENQVDMNETMVERYSLLQSSLSKNGLFFENGDASYWDKMIDELTLRKLDNQNMQASLRASLARLQLQAKAEGDRIGSSIDEEHFAPFSGMINATYVTKNTRVTSGTSLLEVVDCANPIVIVPIPEHRIGEFAVGMKVTVKPVDTNQELSGAIKYISSGPLMGNDKTLQVQEDLTLRGVNAIVNLNDRQALDGGKATCKSAHQAVVVIHNNSPLDSSLEWLIGGFGT